MYQGRNKIELKLGNLFDQSTEKGKIGLPVLAVTMNNGLILRNTLDRKMAPDLPPEKSLLVRPNDIVYNMMRMWQGSMGVSPRTGIVSPAYVVCRPRANIHSKFAYYFFKSPEILHRLRSYSFGITGDRLRLYYKDFASIPVSIPLLTDQIKIADILSTWDTAINQTRDLLAAKQLRKQALEQQLLTGRQRIPNLSKPWEPSSLHNHFERVTRRYDGSCDRVLTISGNDGLVDQLNYFNKRVAAENLSAYFMIKNGEFAFNKSSSNGYPYGAIKQLNKYQKGIVSSLYICFKKRPDSQIDTLFMKYYFDSDQLNRSLRAIAAEGARNHGLLNIAPRDFFNIPITIPEPNEQKAIADILENAEHELTLLRKKLTALEKQKRGLMQKLLTGAIPVKT